ncbi:hypothetical protein B0H34DRAFT_37742 [Crassisporium funariophilum]|nr:hypothetical protein B0H34DRAFT_37742 [Crassisporium funariophilum]
MWALSNDLRKTILKPTDRHASTYFIRSSRLVPDSFVLMRHARRLRAWRPATHDLHIRQVHGSGFADIASERIVASTVVLRPMNIFT